MQLCKFFNTRQEVSKREWRTVIIFLWCNRTTIATEKYEWDERRSEWVEERKRELRRFNFRYIRNSGLYQRPLTRHFVQSSDFLHRSSTSVYIFYEAIGDKFPYVWDIFYSVRVRKPEGPRSKYLNSRRKRSGNKCDTRYRDFLQIYESTASCEMSKASPRMVTWRRELNIFSPT